jgi:putative ABC transport system permease protein
MNTQIILAGLRARPVRTAVGVLAVTLEVVLILLLVGLTNGAISDSGSRVAGVGGEIIVKDENSSYLIGMTPATLPVKEMAADILSVEGVVAAAPVLTQTEPGGGFTMIWGIEPESFSAMSGGFDFLDGHMFTNTKEAIVDDRIANDRHLMVGGPIDLIKRPFTITGIFRNGKGARIFIPLEAAQEMQVRPDKCTMFYVKLKDRSQTRAVIEKLKEKLPGREVVDADEWLGQLYATNATTLGIVFNVIVFIGVIVGVLVIFLSMYTTVTERTREIGILRAMGASKLFIVVLVIQESMVLCVIGAVVGIGASFLLMFTLKAMLPTLSILITRGWVLRAAIFALLSGVIGSIYPAYKAAAQDPIEALAYE